MTSERLSAPEFFRDPYPAYAELREQAQMAQIDGENRFLAIGFDAAYGILRDHSRFSSAGAEGDGDWDDGTAAEEREDGGLQIVLITDDPPRHTRFRGLVNRVFTPRRIAELEPWISGVVGTLLDGFEGDEIDTVEAFNIPLPVQVIATMLGIPPADGDKFKRWSNSLISTAVPPEERMADTMEMVEYLNGAIAERRAAATDDLIGALTAAEIDGEHLANWEVLGFAVLLLVAGNETTTNLLGNMQNVLAGRPDLWERLRADRELVELFIEETLRIDSPVQMLFRWAMEDTEVEGVAIPKGSWIGVCYGAANRDPKVFPEPDEFKLDRGLSRHVAFGMGTHYCLGSPLARMEASLMLNQMLDRYSAIEFGSEPGVRQTTSNIVRGFASLPLRLTPA